MTAAALFRDLVERLDAARIPYMLTGSFASAFHGLPRSTQDIDFVIAPTRGQLRAFVRALPPTAYYADESAAFEALDAESQFNVIDIMGGWKVDLICLRSREFSRTEFARRIRAEIDGLALFVASAEDLVVAKLEWAQRGGSARQIEDVAGILRVRRGELDLAYITSWVEKLGIVAEWSAVRKLAGEGGDPVA